MTRARFALAPLLALVAAPAHGAGLFAATGTASASASAEPARALFADVLILHATNEKRGIDARIGALPELGKAPFSDYDSYDVLDHARLPLKKNDAQNLKLPNGRTLQVSLLEAKGADAVRLSASINRPNGSEFLPLLEVKAHVGQAFIVAGQSYKKGILVLVIRVVK